MLLTKVIENIHVLIRCREKVLFARHGLKECYRYSAQGLTKKSRTQIIFHDRDYWSK